MAHGKHIDLSYLDHTPSTDRYITDNPAIIARKHSTHRTTGPEAPLKEKPSPLNSIGPNVKFKSKTSISAREAAKVTYAIGTAPG